MTVRKKTVADAVSSETKTNEAESSSTNFDDVFNIPQDKSNSSDKEQKKEYELFLGKDRLVRYLPITWNEKYKGKSLRFVIYHDDDCPPARFGTLADLEFLEKKYPVTGKWYISDNLCVNGRHRFVIYKMHVLGIVDTVEA